MGMGKKIQGSQAYFRDDYIMQRCQDKTVLHVGCTDYPFFKESHQKGFLLHEKIVNIAQKVVGVDIETQDVRAMQDFGYDVRVIDAQKLSDYDWEEKFDVILLADVIEHILNSGLVLQESLKLLKKEGIIVVTVPNTFGIIRFLKSFFRYEQVHPDHITYFSSGTLETLAVRLNLEIKELAWYRFEARDPRITVRLSAFFERLVTLLFPWQAEGCIAVFCSKECLNED